jgi:hypothetical protein
MNEAVNNQTKENSKFSLFLTKVFLNKDGSMRPLLLVVLFASPVHSTLQLLYKIGEGIIPMDGYRAPLGFAGSVLTFSMPWVAILSVFVVKQIKKQNLKLTLEKVKVFLISVGFALLVPFFWLSVHAFTTGYAPGETAFQAMLLVGCLGSSLSLAMLVAYVLSGSLEANLEKALAVKKLE